MGGRFKVGEYGQVWGRVSREPKLTTTKSGKQVCGFSVLYDTHHNEDGATVNEFMEVSAWNDLAVELCDENTGLAKNDYVLILGKFALDTYYRENEDKDKQKFKITAELVFSSTSMFQMMHMLVDMLNRLNSLSEDEEAEIPVRTTHKPKPEIHNQGFTDIEGDDDLSGDNPFASSEDDDGELPF